jgi:hypothetical protein
MHTERVAQGGPFSFKDGTEFLSKTEVARLCAVSKTELVCP